MFDFTGNQNVEKRGLTMGVTISSSNHSIDLGCGGFNQLRTTVAKLTEPDIYEHYMALNKGFNLYGEERKNFFENYDKKIEELNEKYENKYLDVLQFLYASDSEGVMDPHHCQSIYDVIKDYDDNVLYGYIGRPDCARFRDFKEIVKECIDTETDMEWD